MADYQEQLKKIADLKAMAAKYRSATGGAVAPRPTPRVGPAGLKVWPPAPVTPAAAPQVSGPVPQTPSGHGQQSTPQQAAPTPVQPTGRGVDWRVPMGTQLNSDYASPYGQSSEAILQDAGIQSRDGYYPNQPENAPIGRYSGGNVPEDFVLSYDRKARDASAPAQPSRIGQNFGGGNPMAGVQRPVDDPNYTAGAFIQDPRERMELAQSRLAQKYQSAGATVTPTAGPALTPPGKTYAEAAAEEKDPRIAPQIARQYGTPYVQQSPEDISPEQAYDVRRQQALEQIRIADSRARAIARTAERNMPLSQRLSRDQEQRQARLAQAENEAKEKLQARKFEAEQKAQERDIAAADARDRKRMEAQAARDRLAEQNRIAAERRAEIRDMNTASDEAMGQMGNEPLTWEDKRRMEQEDADAKHQRELDKYRARYLPPETKARLDAQDEEIRSVEKSYNEHLKLADAADVNSHSFDPSEKAKAQAAATKYREMANAAKTKLAAYKEHRDLMLRAASGEPPTKDIADRYKALIGNDKEAVRKAMRADGWDII